MFIQDRIVIDPAVHHGKPAIKGARLPAVVAGSLADGMTLDEMQREYSVSAAGIRAALKFFDSAHNGQ